MNATQAAAAANATIVKIAAVRTSEMIAFEIFKRSERIGMGSCVPLSGDVVGD